MEALISARAALDTADCEDITPLMAAAHAGEDRCVRLLLKAGADISKVGESLGATALLAAAANGKDAVLKTLLSWGAGVDDVDSQGWTALFAAASQGHIKTQ